MCRNLVATLTVVAGMALSNVVALAQQGAAAAPRRESVAPPALVRFSGTIAGTQGTVGVTFALYRSQTGGAPLWLESQNVNVGENGRYTVLLGAHHARGVPVELFASGEARWLGVQPDGQAERARVVLVSVPYAMSAANADSLGGLPAAAYLRAPVDAHGNYLSTADSVMVDRLARSAGFPSRRTGLLATEQGAVATAGGNQWTTFGPEGVSFFDLNTLAARMFYRADSKLLRIENATGDAVVSMDPASGNVGIGAAAPAARLEVAGDVKVSGKVGIGTGSPAAMLDVRNTTQNVQARFGPNTPVFLTSGATAGPALGLNLYWNSINAAGGQYIYGGNGDGAVLLTGSNGLHFATATAGTAGSAATMDFGMMLSGKKLKVGSDNAPNEALDVAGNILATGNVAGTNVVAAAGLVGASASITNGLSAGSGSFINAGLNAVAVRGEANSGGNSQGVAGFSTDGLGVYGYSGTGTGVYGYSGSGYSGYFFGKTYVGGNLGVGVTSPSEKVDVNGNLRVTGSLKQGAGLTSAPIAYGSFGSDGTKKTGSSNLTCTCDTPSTMYRCKVTGETYTPDSFVVTIVPSSAAGNALFANASVDNATHDLLVRIFVVGASGGATTQLADFHVVIYKP